MSTNFPKVKYFNPKLMSDDLIHYRPNESPKEFERRILKESRKKKLDKIFDDKL